MLDDNLLAFYVLERNKLKKIAKAPRRWIFFGSFLASILTINTFPERFCGKLKLKINLINQKITMHQNMNKIETIDYDVK